MQYIELLLYYTIHYYSTMSELEKEMGKRGVVSQSVEEIVKELVGDDKVSM